MAAGYSTRLYPLTKVYAEVAAAGFKEPYHSGSADGPSGGAGGNCGDAGLAGEQAE
ncbi:hypothetical protein P5G61_25745 [Paenibacillus sp. F6_3S_P_1C]|uniref:Uncharacterized protein n=1 Tax=Paenibacillus vandeheii TaxID=3035917 RepID=A0ABT8JI79_9BACL|nr:hypothetical protein [Paenibacillus vandeheii]MDN4604657.1 hypothetical protein [Paenibacillus vandeheii]